MPLSANTNFYEGGQDLRYKYLSANDVVYVADSYLTQFGIEEKYKGGLWSWGLNSEGQLGLGDRTHRSSPVQVGSLTDWWNISAGNDHTLAVRTNNTLWSFGSGNWGQLGLGFSAENSNRSSPVQVGSLTNWYQVSAGSTFSLSVKTDGTLWSWGSNSLGQLGLGNTTQRDSPVQVGTLTNWKQVSASVSDHSLAVKTDGTLWAWGWNQIFGMLGLGSTTPTSISSPVQVGSLTNWAQVTNGSSTSFAIKTDGTLWAWGSNGAGTLGLNDITHRSSPVQVGALTNWAQVDAGNDHCLAVKTDGTLWAWGRNGSGQLGLNDITHRSSPVQVGALTNWARVSAGSSFSLAVKTDGTLWAWGINTTGRLGFGDLTSRSSPVQVGALTNWLNVSGQVSSIATKR